MYKVRSGYKVGLGLVSVASSSGPNRLDSWWTALWRLKIPAKVNIFIWRVCHGWLPTLSQLAKYGVHVGVTCPVCMRNLETIMHALWVCSNFKAQRRNCLFSRVLEWTDNSSFLDLMLACFHSLKHDELELLCVMFWRGWWIRNQVLHNSNVMCDKDVVSWSENYLASFRSANVREAVLSGSSLYAIVRWCNPERGFYKVNNYAAIHEIVIVFGLVLLFETIWVRLWDPHYSELSSAFLSPCGRGYCNSAWHFFCCGFLPCPAVVDLINLGVAHAADIGVVVIGDILSLINCDSISVSFVSKNANVVAHCLAKLVPSSVDDIFWMESCPPCVESLVQSDMPF
ncbi:hypothetical protein Dsin_025053 [Dipteronia sinensis]|uniref:Reverse transcriptase zinc-binding domain-containing protein n=1 Tax=Dipteronia sinensis TaxID=43782 RepID=A0AAE0DWR5_9ROSI|nr:hypothetical protein Dsin_025053 [Dipteronia sinensis]